MSAPFVSIVVVSYNYARFLGQAIDSALAQSYAKREVIVVDDGSTDGSQQIIARYGDRVRSLFKRNGGETSAANMGFAATRGDIVLFLDSDDALRPEAIARVVERWYPGISLMQFCLAVIDGEGRFGGTVFPHFPEGWTPERARKLALATGRHPYSPTSGCAYSRAYLQAVMPLPAEVFKHGPDGPLNYVAPLYGDVVTLDEPLGFYRIHGANAWAQQQIDVERFRSYIIFEQLLDRYFREHAVRLGHTVPADLHERADTHLVWRLISLKLSPQRHPVPADRLPRLTIRAMSTALAAGERRPSSRLLQALWILSLATTSRPIAKQLVGMRFGQIGRPTPLRALLRRLRVTREPGADRATLSLMSGP